MSDEAHVNMRPELLPTPTAWAETIRQAGFELDIDSDFEWDSVSGFRPATYKGQPAGFELYYGIYDLSSWPDELQKELGDRPQDVMLKMHGGPSSLSAMIAAAVLCSITDGRLIYLGDFVPIDASQAIAWARKEESRIARYRT
jgi:hypothetical protein